MERGEKQESAGLDWNMGGGGKIAIHGTVLNPVVEQMNTEEGMVTSLDDSWNRD